MTETAANADQQNRRNIARAAAGQLDGGGSRTSERPPTTTAAAQPPPPVRDKPALRDKPSLATPTARQSLMSAGQTGNCQEHTHTQGGRVCVESCSARRASQSQHDECDVSAETTRRSKPAVPRPPTTTRATATDTS